MTFPHLSPYPLVSYLQMTLNSLKQCPPDSTVLTCSKDINALQQWSILSGLNFNVAKTFLLSFCSRSHHLCVDCTLNNSIIPKVTAAGILFSQNLSWTDHYNFISKNAYSQLSLIRHSFSSACPLSIKKLLYTSLVRSKLTYCSQVWCPMLLKDISNLERNRIQRRATKYIIGHSALSYRTD